jgi:formylglycine-generating enzyme required for sulfatase activity
VDVGTVVGTDFETGPAVDAETVVGTDFETGPAVDAETVVGTDSETGSDDVVKLETTPADPAAQPPLKQPQESITNTIGMHLKLIPAGTFMMGSPETVKGHRNDEHHHEVTVSKAFYMQTTEVTQGQWKAVM